MDSDDERDQEELNEALCEACSQGRIMTAFKLIMKGADVNHVWGQGRHQLHNQDDPMGNKHRGLTPALLTIMYGHHQLLPLIILNGADLSYTENGRSALHYAATLDPPEGTEIASILLEEGCDINVEDDDQNTPLIWAINYNQLDMVKFLLEHGASVDSSVTQYGHNPVLECVHVAHLMDLPMEDVVDMLEVFIEKGSDIRAKDKDGRDAIHWADEFGMGELSRYLMSKSKKEEEVLVEVKKEVVQTPTTKTVTFMTNETDNKNKDDE